MKSLRANTRRKEQLQIVGLQKDMQMTQCQDIVAIIHLSKRECGEIYLLQMHANHCIVSMREFVQCGEGQDISMLLRKGGGAKYHGTQLDGPKLELRWR